MPYRRSREDEKMEDESLEIAADIGRALITIQFVELLLDALLKTAFCGERVPTVREIEDRRDDLRSLVNRLQKRVELDPKFKTYLKRFVKDRNRFVHNLVEELVKKSASEEEAHRYYELAWVSIFRLISFPRLKSNQLPGCGITSPVAFEGQRGEQAA